MAKRKDVIQHKPITSKKDPKKPQNLDSIKKDPKKPQNPDSFYGQTPVWSFVCCDFDHERWGLCKDSGSLEDLFKRLKAFEGQKWGQILTDTTGRKSNTKSHPIPVHTIEKEAQERLIELNLDDSDVLYSLSITGRKRLWGIMLNRTFCILWFDREHEVYKAEKRHT
jgi:hypothetical protein